MSLLCILFGHKDWLGKRITPMELKRRATIAQEACEKTETTPSSGKKQVEPELQLGGAELYAS